MTIRLHQGDLPDGYAPGHAVAIDTETLGLNPARDRLCVVQLSTGDGTADVVQIARGQGRAPNLARLLADAAVVKLFHFARFDIASLFKAFGVMAAPIYCTKIASKLARTYTAYAASDVLHLHQLRERLDAMLQREGRDGYAQAAFAFLPTRARLDLDGWGETDLFAHM